MSTAKRLLSVLLALCVLAGAFPATTIRAADTSSDAAEDLQVYSASYFGAQLTNDAEIVFYNALQEMYQNEEFLNGTVAHKVEVGDGAGQLSADLLTRYMAGDASLLQMYENAINAFWLDNSDLFYVDWDKLSVRIGTSNNEWTVYIGSGAYTNLYLESAGYTSKAAIESDISKLESAIAEIAADAKAYSSTRQGQIEYVHDTLVKMTEYVYLGTTDVPGDTAAGPLVYGKAWCEGYARAFKLIMDALEIPCILVGGAGLPEAGQNGDTLVSADVEAHMWNYVYMLDGKWYAVDVTYDDPVTETSGDTVRQTNLLKGSNVFSACHVENGVFSANGMTFSYPVLSAGNIGEGDGDGSGLSVNVSYYDKDDGSGNMTSYTVMQPVYTEDGTTLYGKEISADGHYLYYKPIYVDSDGNRYLLYSDDTWFASGYLFSVYDDRTVGCCTAYDDEYIQIGYQFAIADTGTSGFYMPDDAVILETSEIIYFRDRYQDLRTLTPSIIEREPTNYAYITEDDLTDGKVHVKYTYDMPLMLADGYTAASLKVSTTLSGPDYKVENLTWKNTTKSGFDGSTYDCCVVEFDFYPDTSYNYSGTSYTFALDGLVSIANGNQPRSGSLMWKSSAVNRFPCPYSASPSELLLSMYPTLVNTTYSSELFTDPVGNGLSVGSNNYDLNLTLIASKPSSEEQQEMSNALVDEVDGTIQSVYSLDLTLACLAMRILVNNTLSEGDLRICIAIPYPDGYDARNIAGTTFEAYHFGVDENGNYVPEKLICNATDTGIWIIANSFSPFMVVAVEKDENYTAAAKTISAVTDSEMADVTVTVTSADGSTDTTQIPEVTELREGESCTYTFTPKSGYALEQVIWNGEKRTVTANSDGSYSFTYTFDELSQESNTLHVNFCAESVLAAESAAGFEVQNPVSFISYAKYENVLDTISTSSASYSAEVRTLGSTVTEEIQNTSGIILSNDTLELVVGNTASLTLTEGNAADNTWSSSDPSVATVSDGTVTAVSEGISYISVENSNGDAFCKVEVISACTHDWDDGEETKAATCTEDGVKTYVCKVCYAEKTEAISAVGHSYTAAPTFTWSDDYTSAVAEFVCAVCDESETVTCAITSEQADGKTIYTATAQLNGASYVQTLSVDSPEQNPDENTHVHSSAGTVIENEIAASCTEDGSYDSVVYCSICGEEMSRTVVPIKAAGHTWDTGTVTKQPTLTAEGVMTYTCTVCGVTKTESIDKLTACDGGETCPAYDYEDVNTAAWYHPYVDFVIEAELMVGYPDGTFRPDNNLTRAEMVQILYNWAGKPAVSGTSKYSDVASGIWYTTPIIWATQNGVVNGYDNGNFGPEDNVTREQIAVMLYRYAGEPATSGSLSQFTDANTASEYAVAALKWAVEQGILEGYGDGTLRPRENATRAQIAAMLNRYIAG